jgi:protease I
MTNTREGVRVANAAERRTVTPAVRFAATMVRNGAPVGVICHGPWTVVEGDVLHGRTIGRISAPTSGSSLPRRGAGRWRATTWPPATAY